MNAKRWILVLALGASGSLASCTNQGAVGGTRTMNENRNEIDAVRSVVAAVTHHIDAKRWSELEALFAPDVNTDYTSLFGGTATRQPRAALVSGWRGALGPVATQHLLGPIEVQLTSTGARAECHVRALHRAAGAPSGELWEVLGHYVFELARPAGDFTINAMKLELLLQTGNTKLLAEAGTPAK